MIGKRHIFTDNIKTWVSDVDNKNFKRTSMGIVMKRRDNAPIVKCVFWKYH